MKNKKVLILIICLAFLFIFCACSSIGMYMLFSGSDTSSDNNEQTLVADYDISSFDLDQKNGIIYFRGYKKDPKIFLAPADLYKYDIDRNELTLLKEIAFDSSIGHDWVSLSKDGTLFTVDIDNSLGEEDPSLIEVDTRGNTINEYEITTGISSVYSVDSTCEGVELVDSSSDFVGMVKSEDGELMPRFAIVENAGGRKSAVQIGSCEYSKVRQHKANFFSRNLSVLNRNVFEDSIGGTYTSRIDKENDFEFKEVKRFGIANFECEKWVDTLVWDDKEYKIGSCIHGVNTLAESGYIFYDGKPIFSRVDGIHMLTKE